MYGFLKHQIFREQLSGKRNTRNSLSLQEEKNTQVRTPAVGLPLGAPPSANKRRVPNATISCNFPLPKPPKRWKDVKSYWNIHNGYSDYILDIVVSLTSIFWRVCIYWYQTQSALHRWGGDSGDESEVLMQDTHGLIWIRVNLYFCIHA
jgi:hypothetical protein